MEGLNLATSLLCVLGTQVVSGHLSTRRRFLAGPERGHTPRRFPLPLRTCAPSSESARQSISGDAGLVTAQSHLTRDSPAAFIERPLPGELAPPLSLVLPFSIQALASDFFSMQRYSLMIHRSPLQKTAAPCLPLPAQPAMFPWPGRQVPLLHQLEEHQLLGVSGLRTPTRGPGPLSEHSLWWSPLGFYFC